MIPRDLQPQLLRLAASFPAVLLTGPRQSGKTTLARAVFPHLPYVSLENPDTREFAATDPRSMIVNLHDLGRFRRFISLCASRIGQLINLASLAADAGVSQPTARSWLDVLEASYLVLRVAPYHRNFGKRLVRTPKLYFCDTGLAAWLLGIADPSQLTMHPLRGPLFENGVIVDIVKHRWNHGNLRPPYFWRDSNGREVDLVLDDGPRLLGIEIKSGATFAGDWERGLTAWRETVGERNSERPVVIWGGADSGPRSHSYALAWDAIDRLPETLARGSN